MATEPQPIETTEAIAARLRGDERVEAARLALREQLEAAWSMRVAQAEELLRESARIEVESILDANLAALGEQLAAERARLEKEREENLNAVVSLAVSRSARALTGKLNECGRRLRSAGDEQEWVRALYDAAALFAPRVAVFRVRDGKLSVAHAPFAEPAGDVPLSGAPAIHDACESGEPVVALYAAQELSAELVAAFGQPAGSRAHLFPVMSRGEAAAVLYAEGGQGECDGDALELLATLAEAVWEASAGWVKPASPGPQLVTLQVAHAHADSAAPVRSPLPAWADVPAGDRDHHLRAQRFARVRVAEMRLYKSALVLEGRRTSALYSLLREEIDKARDEFSEHFLDPCESMTDYLHAELVRTLANDDARLLGGGYPGPLT